MIGDAVAAQGPRDASVTVFGFPWLVPWTHAFLKCGDDLAGDLLIDVGFHSGLPDCRLRMQPELGQRQ